MIDIFIYQFVFLIESFLIMRRKNPIIIRSSTSSTHQQQRRQRLLSSTSVGSSSSSQRFAAAAGETTAGCAAICCCCPCGIMKLLFLAVFKVPAGLCRRALRLHRRRRRRHLIKNNNDGMSSSSSSLTSMGTMNNYSRKYDQFEYRVRSMGAEEAEMGFEEEVFVVEREAAREMMKVEKEMWDRFYSAGFWRSPSSREPAAAVAAGVGRVELVASAHG